MCVLSLAFSLSYIFLSSLWAPWMPLALAQHNAKQVGESHFSPPAPEFGADFGRIWYDGKAEVSSYLLTMKRYGELRKGNVVTIFVTEDFDPIARVKSERQQNRKPEAVPVMKLNLMHDFPTGIYDYNLMMSSFVATKAWETFSPGSQLKVSFSSQEWCGHVYHQLIPKKDNLQSVFHSYFEGEADQQLEIPFPERSLFADSILLWARGFAAPLVNPGDTLNIHVFERLMDSRLAHFQPKFEMARLSVSEQVEDVRGPDKTWKARLKTVETGSGRKYRIWVEDQEPHRIVKWEFSGGRGLEEEATMVRSTRLPYWQLQSNDHQGRLAEIGMTPRARMSP